MPDYTAEIARLRKILNSGISSYNQEGQQVNYDLDQVRKRLAELEALDDQTVRRPRVTRIKLSGF